MSEPHRSALRKRDRLREKNPEAAEQYEAEYVRAIGEGAPPFYARNIANMTMLRDMAKQKIESGDVHVPDGTNETLDGLQQERRAWREDAGLPPERDADDVTDADELPAIEDLSDAAHSAVS